MTLSTKWIEALELVERGYRILPTDGKIAILKEVKRIRFDLARLPAQSGIPVSDDGDGSHILPNFAGLALAKCRAVAAFDLGPGAVILRAVGVYRKKFLLGSVFFVSQAHDFLRCLAVILIVFGFFKFEHVALVI